MTMRWGFECFYNGKWTSSLKTLNTLRYPGFVFYYKKHYKPHLVVISPRRNDYEVRFIMFFTMENGLCVYLCSRSLTPSGSHFASTKWLGGEVYSVFYKGKRTLRLLCSRRCHYYCFYVVNALGGHSASTKWLWGEVYIVFYDAKWHFCYASWGPPAGHVPKSPPSKPSLIIIK